MTHEYEVWINTLNGFGTGVEPPFIQELLNAEHQRADPTFVPIEEKLKEEDKATGTTPICESPVDVSSLAVPAVLTD